MDKKLLQRFDEYISVHSEEIVHDLMELVRVPSVRNITEPGAPFGRECADCLAAAKVLFEKHGFDVCVSNDNTYATISVGAGENKIGIFAHLDVVPAEGTWLFAENPFEPKRIDNCLIGRGVQDNKAGVIMSLYTMKMLGDLGADLGCVLEVFLGLNEESGMEDIKSYVKSNARPNVSLVPDGDFPVSVGEKSICRFNAVCKNKFSDIVSFGGGTAFNIVLGELDVKLKYSDALYCEAQDICRKDERLSASSDGAFVYIRSEGVSKHAAMPDGAINAAAVFANAFKNCTALCKCDRRILADISDIAGDFHGACFDIEHKSPSFGRLTCVNGICKLVDARPSLSFDVRFAPSVKTTDIAEKIRSSAAKRGFEISDVNCSNGFEIESRNEFAEALENVYNYAAEAATGNKSGERAFCCDGATYARIIGGNAFSVGTQAGYAGKRIKMQHGYGEAHQPDEQLSIGGFLEAIKILAAMTVECAETLKSK